MRECEADETPLLDPSQLPNLTLHGVIAVISSFFPRILHPGCRLPLRCGAAANEASIRMDVESHLIPRNVDRRLEAFQMMAPIEMVRAIPDCIVQTETQFRIVRAKRQSRS